MKPQLRLIQSVAEIATIAPAWHELACVCGPAMNDPVWYENAARFTHGSSDRLHILSGWQQDRLVALAPLVLTRGDGGSRYEIIGSRVLYEPAEVLVRDAQAATWIADEIARLDRPVLLARLPDNSDFHAAFTSRARRSGLVLTSHSSGAPYVSLSGAWADYEASLTTHTRSELRRRQRKLRALGEVSVQFAMPDEGDAPGLLREAFDVESRSWKGRAGSAILQRDDLREFFMRHGLDSARRGELHISMLRLDGVAIATHIATVDGRVYRQLKIGYDERYRKYSPGLQLLLETLRWSFERGLETHELLGTEEGWSREWASTVHRCTNMLFYPFNARGVAGLLRDGFARVRRRVLSNAGGKRGIGNESRK
jgi:CelD/BcsL family acetyltransferase involved in cellulose biosynthesis